jgi:hypothetical protein
MLIQHPEFGTKEVPSEYKDKFIACGWNVLLEDKEIKELIPVKVTPINTQHHGRPKRPR